MEVGAGDRGMGVRAEWGRHNRDNNNDDGSGVVESLEKVSGKRES